MSCIALTYSTGKQCEYSKKFGNYCGVHRYTNNKIIVHRSDNRLVFPKPIEFRKTIVNRMLDLKFQKAIANKMADPEFKKMVDIVTGRTSVNDILKARKDKEQSMSIYKSMKKIVRTHEKQCTVCTKDVKSSLSCGCWTHLNCLKKWRSDRYVSVRLCCNECNSYLEFKNE